MPVAAKDAFYIKLGRGGEWEADCLKQGFLQFGYRETPHELCLAGEWDKVRDFWAARRGDQGTATRDMKQIRAFYEADENCLFITFANGLLYWCKPTGPVEILPDRSHRRATVDGSISAASSNVTSAGTIKAFDSRSSTNWAKPPACREPMNEYVWQAEYRPARHCSHSKHGTSGMMAARWPIKLSLTPSPVAVMTPAHS
jgi:hypothetical protein